jgi:hypothetical protein
MWRNMVQTDNVEKYGTDKYCGEIWYSQIMWRNMVQPDNVEKYGTDGECGEIWYSQKDRPQMAIRHIHIACRIIKAKDTHSEYVILIAIPGNSGYANAP